MIKWLRHFLIGSRSEKNPPQVGGHNDAQPDGLESLKAYAEQRKREIFDDYQKQLAAGTLHMAPTDEAQVDPKEELKRAHLLMLQAQELLAIGNAKGAIAVLEEADRINKKYTQQ